MPLWHCMPLLLSRQFHIISPIASCYSISSSWNIAETIETRATPSGLGVSFTTFPLVPFFRLRGRPFDLFIRDPVAILAPMQLHVMWGCIMMYIDMYQKYQYVSICIMFWHVACKTMRKSTFKGWQSRKMRRAAQHENSSTSPSSFALSLSFVSLCGGMTRTKSSNEFKRVQHKSFVLFNVFSPCLTMLHSEPILDPSNGLHGLKRHGLRNVRAATE